MYDGLNTPRFNNLQKITHNYCQRHSRNHTLCRLLANLHPLSSTQTIPPLNSEILQVLLSITFYQLKLMLLTSCFGQTFSRFQPWSLKISVETRIDYNGNLILFLHLFKYKKEVSYKKVRCVLVKDYGTMWSVMVISDRHGWLMVYI